jgi:hypothetical protein
LNDGGYTDGDRVHLETAAKMAEAAFVLIDRASTALRIVHPRHPLYYRANQLLRNLSEFEVEARRESGK